MLKRVTRVHTQEKRKIQILKKKQNKTQNTLENHQNRLSTLTRQQIMSWLTELGNIFNPMGNETIDFDFDDEGLEEGEQ